MRGACSGFSHPFPAPLYFPLSISVTGVCLLWGMGGHAWGVMPGLSGFGSHWCSLHLGAGCQQWKLQDVSGTQTPDSNAVVNSF